MVHEQDAQVAKQIVRSAFASFTSTGLTILKTSAPIEAVKSRNTRSTIRE